MTGPDPTSTVTTPDDSPRYGHSFHRIQMIDVHCALCGVIGSDPYNSYASTTGIPYFYSLESAVERLPARHGWTRAPELEPADVSLYDQRWLCPACTDTHHCNVHGHQPETTPARRTPSGTWVGPCERCSHCRAYLTRPPLKHPGRLMRLWVILRQPRAVARSLALRYRLHRYLRETRNPSF
ncbi:hypothetical protein [Acrocarpospora catenulata]|uniref:hypothetical protein n=1 Tax=Acrocarpospora catenulata TaxID=2836182 RepID=UPI001BDAB78D|nr:hypothetical protein [Acrocarpospora catenulata]